MPLDGGKPDASARTQVGLDGSVYLRRYVDLARLLVVEVDVSGTVRLANRHLCDVLGWKEEELVGKNWFDTVLPERARAAARARFREAVGGGIDTIPKVEETLLARDGAERRVVWHGTAVKDEAGAVAGLFAAGEDVTDLYDARRELEDYKSALDLSAIVATTDANGKITYVNDRFVEISKYARHELIGRTHKIVNSGTHSKEFFREMWDTINAGRVWKGDMRNRAKDGSFYWVATTIVPFVDANGKPYQHLAIRFEITARKSAEEALERAVRELADLSERERQRAEALAEANRRIVEEQSKLIQAEKLSSVGLLAAGVAHEINNPLAGVMSCVRALREGTVDGERREEYFEAVRDGLERIRATVQGLLDFARPQGTGVTDVDCHEIVSACLLLVAPYLRKKGIEIDLRLDKSAVCLRGNRSQLIQAAMNVLLNAIHASPDGSRIEVDAVEEATRVGLRFRDHGAGIPREVLSRVTDAFFTTKDPGQGTGLGLAVTAGILQAHGGELAIESEPGDGTTVTFWLPRTAAAG